MNPTITLVPFDNDFVRQNSWLGLFPRSCVAGKWESAEGTTWVIRVRLLPGTKLGIRPTDDDRAVVTFLAIGDKTDSLKAFRDAVVRTLKFAGIKVD
ncbi:MAG: hypothetical protein AAB865_01325 [Patescibacteria group bacterium]